MGQHDEDYWHKMKKHWVTITWLCCMLGTLSVKGQVADSMIYNPSFESHTRCPERVDALGVMNEVEGWWQPTRGSSDYFHTCGGRECLVPRNKMGTQTPHSGEAYCGIYCSQENYREYLQTELREPLAAGGHYRVSFWVSLAEKSPHAVATISALFTRERIEDTSWNLLMNREVTSINGDAAQSIRTLFEPQVTNSEERLLDNTTGWEEVSGEFIAQGGERFLTLGNFLPFNRSHVVDLEKPSAILPGAYYYIDDVSLVRLDSVAPQPPLPEPAPVAGDIVRIDGIYFATGESEILQQSYRELVLLCNLLKKHPTMHIELRGHTDSQGTADYNQRLSEQRAKAVADHLVSHGIERKRITWTGFGESLPVSSNDSEEGRQKNRRVEYRIISL